MSNSIPRVRMFAGPNGSGKTTIKQQLQRPPEWFGVDINPDDIERQIANTGFLPLAPYCLQTTAEEIQSYFRASLLLRQYGLAESAGNITVTPDAIDFGEIEFGSYHASVLADFLRRNALSRRLSLTFETVMSASDKPELLQQAQIAGYRTYLYFVATEDPEINIQRVRNRVADGGHDVPQDKVRSRYLRSLNNLPTAIRYSHRTYLFDTSRELPLYFAEITNGITIELKSEAIPRWFVPIWESFDQATE